MLIYLSKINPTLDQETINTLLPKISKENQKRCQRFRFKEDTLRTLYGELIVRHVICQQLSYKNEDITILKEDGGKPYIKGRPIHFNVSHAGEYVVSAFSEHEVGIDIEQMKEIDINIADRFFYQQEYVDLLAQEPSAQFDYFFSLWTLKESYIKWLGTGLSTPLDSFCFRITDTGITCTDDKREIMPFFKQYPVCDYKLSVCSLIKDFPDKVKKITIEELIL